MPVKLVVDASVALKWFFRTGDEEGVPAALEILRGVAEGRVELVQPPHFLAEVAAVLAREAPRQARSRLRLLAEVEMRVVDDTSALELAVELATRLDHHVFDTLYHAVALLEKDAILVTADARYLGKARGMGAIGGLASFADGA